MQEDKILEEQQAKEEQIVKQLEEEKEKKRQAKQEELRAKEEEKQRREDFMQKMKFAKMHHERTLVRRYILGTFKHLIKTKNQKLRIADQQHLKWQKKTLIHKLRTAVSIQRYEDAQDIKKMSDTAYAFNEFNTKVAILQHLRQNCKENQRDALFYRKKVYDKYLQRRTFQVWLKLQGFLKKENQILDSHRMNIVAKFRQIKLGRKALMALQDSAQDAKIEKEKDLYKNQMRSKVS